MAQHHIDSYPSGGEAAGNQNEATTTSKARNVAFKGLVILFSLFVLLSFNVVFLMIIVSWLPDATYLAIIGELEPADLVHRVHDSILPIIAWALLVGTVVQLRRPQIRLAPLLMALAVPVAFTVVELATGTYTFMGTGPALVALVLSALLHPRARELASIRRLDSVMGGLTAVAAAVWIPFAYRQAQLQQLATPGDAHAEMEHWNRMAVFALLVIIWALIGSSDRSGWRLTAWIAGLSSMWYGFQSLLFPAASAASLPWALAAIGWGIAYIFVAERRARSVAVDHGEEAVQPA